MDKIKMLKRVREKTKESLCNSKNALEICNFDEENSVKLLELIQNMTDKTLYNQKIEETTISRFAKYN